MEITKDFGYGFDFRLPTRTWEYAGEDVSPCRRHPSQIMHPAIFPELRIISGSLPVNDPCDFGALDENVMREEITVSEIDLCLRREAAEQLLHKFLSTEIEEETAIVVEVLLDARERVRWVPRVRHEPVVIGSAVDRAERRARVRAHLVENGNQLVRDAVQFGGGHAADDAVERHAAALVHEEIPHAVRDPVPGLDDDGAAGTGGEGRVMQHARRGDGREAPVDELERAHFRVVVPAKFYQDAGREARDGLVAAGVDAF